MAEHKLPDLTVRGYDPRKGPYKRVSPDVGDDGGLVNNREGLYTPDNFPCWNKGRVKVEQSVFTLSAVWGHLWGILGVLMGIPWQLICA
ncbi:hypothetical protein GSI_11586 [Ganoderma sinense ZZ0214-1]|uniref:Uncharacterized protein n=1 Tax=Ganoderma sinense ZZ0214-1 TaxID=1077348 RepID=A0A2G8RWE3_9APHY|nr:hypothetical protein GSI_11586 [Ganoderma sinense ZZ0214-1]